VQGLQLLALAGGHGTLAMQIDEPPRSASAIHTDVEARVTQISSYSEKYAPAGQSFGNAPGIVTRIPTAAPQARMEVRYPACYLTGAGHNLLRKAMILHDRASEVRVPFNICIKNQPFSETC
jgi:hypothetical protein